MKMTVEQVDRPYKVPLRISDRALLYAPTVVVYLEAGGCTGRGEGLPIFYRDQTAQSVIAEIEAMRPAIEGGIERVRLNEIMAPGGARNALDCALWDLEAKSAGQPAWLLAGLSRPKTLTTSLTIALGEPGDMARAAARAAPFPILKLKLGGPDDLACVKKVRIARPDAILIVDANQGWDIARLRSVIEGLMSLDVKLIEQPLPSGSDSALADFESPIPLCADESCQTAASLAGLAGKYQFVNIKLDKTGGLTAALELARHAQDAGFRLMVGCMSGSSLSMAPAFLVGQLCEFVDLDGPLLSTTDIDPPIAYDGGAILSPTPSLWG